MLALGTPFHRRHLVSTPHLMLLKAVVSLAYIFCIAMEHDIQLRSVRRRLIWAYMRLMVSGSSDLLSGVASFAGPARFAERLRNASMGGNEWKATGDLNFLNDWSALRLLHSLHSLAHYLCLGLTNWEETCSPHLGANNCVRCFFSALVPKTHSFDDSR